MKGRTDRGPLLVSITIHIVVILVLARIVLPPGYLVSFVGLRRGERPVAEKVTYVTSAPRGAATIATPSRPAARPTPAVAAPPIVAPQTVPTVIPVPTPAQPETPPPTAGPPGTPTGPVAHGPVGVGGATGSRAGGGGGTSDIGSGAAVRPTRIDPLVWAIPARSALNKTDAEKMKDDIWLAMKSHEDSAAVAAARRQPGDWTTKIGGQTWGIDPQYIHIGPISIPTVLLGLLPIKAQINPGVADYNRTIGAMNAEIRAGAATAADLKDEGKRIRERLERERAAKKAAADAAAAAAAAKPPPPPPLAR
jgi:hypothetical protein